MAGEEALSDEVDYRRQSRGRFIKQLRSISEQAEQDGYAAGMARALNEMTSAHQHQQRQFRDTENRLVDFVIAALEKIIRDLPPNLVTRGIVRSALSEIHETSMPVVLEIHPQMAVIVSEQLAHWQAAHSSVPPVEIREVDNGHPLSCRLDLGDSVIDASLLTQLKALEQSLSAATADAS